MLNSFPYLQIVNSRVVLSRHGNENMTYRYVIGLAWVQRISIRIIQLGIDGIHSHMTNTLNTPVEKLEIAYPLRIERYEFRPDSCGGGKWRGGLGIRRDIRVVDHQTELSLLGDRRVTRPYGIFGGEARDNGSDFIIVDGEETLVKGKGSVTLKPGSIISIRTPGGGGYGNSSERPDELVLQDYRDGRISAEYALKHFGLDLRGK